MNKQKYLYAIILILGLSACAKPPAGAFPWTLLLSGSPSGSTANTDYPRDVAYTFDSVQAAAFSGETVTIKIKTTSGNSPVNEDVYLSSNTILSSSSDTKIGSLTVATTSDLQTFTFNIPCSLAPGTYYVGLIKKYVLSTTTVKVAAGGSCTGSGISFYIDSIPEAAMRGGTITVPIEVSVGASPTAVSCTFRFHTSSNIQSYNGTVSDTIAIPLTSGRHNITLNVPTSLSTLSGPYYIGAAGTDCTHVSPNATKIYTTPMLLDFTSAPTSLMPGGTAEFTLSRQVIDSTSDFVCGVYFSTDSNVNASDTPAGDVTVHATDGPENFSVTIPATLYPGKKYYIGLFSASTPGCNKKHGLSITDLVPPAVPVTVSGQITFERPAINTTTYKLNTSSLSTEPARGVTVRLLNYNDDVIATTTSDSDGNYALSGSINGYYKISAIAEMIKSSSGTHNIVVRDPLKNRYGVNGDPLFAGTGGSLITNLTALHSNRGNAPFAILDSFYKAIEKVRSVTPNVDLPPLYVRWQDLSTMGTYFTQTAASPPCGDAGVNCIVLLGNQYGDSDEFDEHVITHEFMHFLEANLSRSDSIGGGHSTNDALEPRVAYGEGLANAMSGIFLNNPQYADTNNAGGFGFNLETGTHTLKGFYSEASIQSVIWDLFDSDNEGADALSLSFAEIWTAVLSLKNIDGITWIHEFISSLKSTSPGNVTEIDAILASENIAADSASEANVSMPSASFPGIPSHTCDGSTAAYMYNPIVQTLSGSGSILTSTAFSGSQWCGAVAPGLNKLFGSQFFYVTPTASGTMTVTATDDSPSSEDPDIFVFRRGTPISYSANAGSDTISVSVTAGTAYVVEIRTYSLCMDALRQGASCSTAQKSASGANNYSVEITLP